MTQAQPQQYGQSSAPHIYDAKTVANLTDWGVQADAIEGQSHSSGLLLYKSGDQQMESGLWVCTPGSWRLNMPGDELCFFHSGRATYTEHNGETIEVTPGTVVHFPSGWSGRCDVHETIRNTYMLVQRPRDDRSRHDAGHAQARLDRSLRRLGSRADDDRRQIPDLRQAAA